MDPAVLTRHPVSRLTTLAIVVLLGAPGCIDSAEYFSGADTGGDLASPKDSGGEAACTARRLDELAWWSAALDRCFYFVNVSVDWLGGESVCATRFDGHLATIADLTEQVQAAKAMEAVVLAEGFDPWEVWIGLRSEDGADWSWSDPAAQGTPWTDGWQAGQPNDSPPPLCAYMYRSAGWKWHDGLCAAEVKPVLCQN